jgi:hypothetical protein
VPGTFGNVFLVLDEFFDLLAGEDRFQEVTGKKVFQR